MPSPTASAPYSVDGWYRLGPTSRVTSQVSFMSSPGRLSDHVWITSMIPRTSGSFGTGTDSYASAWVERTS